MPRPERLKFALGRPETRLLGDAELPQLRAERRHFLDLLMVGGRNRSLK
jgi:hypothetical protein